MAARAAVRASYANVLRAQRVVFRDDMRASTMARERTKLEYLKHRDVTDPAEVERLVHRRLTKRYSG
jgi:hypothetical protein